MPNLVLVNEKDEEISTADAIECHRGQGRLHRAFTVFLLNSRNQLLVQQRSNNKLLWPLTWESSCSSHPLPGEDYLTAGEKRLKVELGISCKLALRNKFQYFAKYRDVGSENEVCALLIGKYSGDVRPNSEEVEQWKWIDLEE
ncbi:isopentenyl-diphosphate Delta-isomerase, partial [Chloroflexota bacterium]